MGQYLGKERLDNATGGIDEKPGLALVQVVRTLGDVLGPRPRRCLCIKDNSCDVASSNNTECPAKWNDRAQRFNASTYSGATADSHGLREH